MPDFPFFHQDEQFRSKNRVQTIERKPLIHILSKLSIFQHSKSRISYTNRLKFVLLYSFFKEMRIVLKIRKLNLL